MLRLLFVSQRPQSNVGAAALGGPAVTRFADADFGRAPDLFAAPSETIDRAWCTSEDLVREELKKV